LPRLSANERVAQHAVVRGKHLLRKPHLMPISHINLSLD